MMRIGLGARLTLAIVGGLVAIQGLGLAAVLWLREPDGAAWRPPMPSRVAAAADALDASPPAIRDAYLIGLNGDQTRFFISDGVPAGYRVHEGLAPVLYRGYRQALADRDFLVLRPEEAREWRPREGALSQHAFSVQLADGRRLNVTPGVMQRRRGLTTVFLMTAFGMAALSAVFVARLIRLATAQLESLSEAADSFAADLGAPPMTEQGPQEVRRVAVAFNRMQAELRRLMAERLNMLAAAAHDLKTLLTRLRLRVAGLEDEAQRAKADADIAEMAGLIEDVLLVAQGETRQPRREVVSLRPFVEDLVTTRQELGQAVGADRLEIAYALAEPSALRRILDNLIDNALKYAGEVSLGIGSSADNRIEVRVVDHGPGLPADFADRAFEPFARHEPSRNRATGGAGLGLSIAQTLARQMRGDIVLTPTPGGGLTATVLLERR